MIRTAALVSCLLACLAEPVIAQDPLTPVRDFYGAAAYEEALAALGTMAIGNPGTSIEAEHYRAYCLLALGRTAEADRVIEGIVAADPLGESVGEDQSPRIRAAFGAARRRALPGIVRTLYAEGRAAFDRQAFAEAERTLGSAVRLIDTPEVVNRPGMDDLRTLASGFLALARARKAPAAPAALAPIAVRPTVSLERAAHTEHAALMERAGRAEAARDTLPPSEPVVIRQDLPVWSAAPVGFDVVYRGAIVVDIDEQGQVAGASLVEPIHPMYNQDLLRAARGWQYEPAMRDGRPVRSQKRVEVELRPR